MRIIIEDGNRRFSVHPNGCGKRCNFKRYDGTGKDTGDFCTNACYIPKKYVDLIVNMPMKGFSIVELNEEDENAKGKL